MSDNRTQIFEKIVEEARADPNILGVFLSGSRGKGFETEHSDYDIVMIIKDEGFKAYEKRFPFHYAQGVECILHSLSGFKKYAPLGSKDAWDRYSFAHVNAILDKTGEIQALIDAKGSLPSEAQADFVRAVLDTYVSSLYRSFKCHRRGDAFGAKLEAASSILPLLEFIFGLEGRHAPFLGYLEREFSHYPLSKFPMNSKTFLEHVAKISDGDIAAQGQLFCVVEALSIKAEMLNVLEAWDEGYPWIKSYSAP